jgi:DNA-directed RNA polymerase subunit RPC12/RpoP
VIQMDKKWSRQSVKNLQAAVWLIGLGVLFLLRSFWPGILILIGVSIVIQALLPEAEAAVPEPVPPAAEPPAAPEVVEEEALADPVPPLDEELHAMSGELPAECPACGGPVRENAQAVLPAGKGQVVCPFCGRKILTA